jgi:hypothetical protein
MSWLVFFLGLILTGAGGYGLYASVDLVGADAGSLYGTCGAIGVAGGVVTIAIGALIRRVDALRPPLLALSHATSLGEAIAYGAPLAEASTPGRRAPESDDVVIAYAPADAAETQAPEPAGGRSEAEAVATQAENAAPAGPSTLVGRYSAGGASYKIFSDGSIEADTDQGAFRFASMTDFKAFIASKRPSTEQPPAEPPPFEA